MDTPHMAEGMKSAADALSEGRRLNWRALVFLTHVMSLLSEGPFNKTCCFWRGACLCRCGRFRGSRQQLSAPFEVGGKQERDAVHNVLSFSFTEGVALITFTVERQKMYFKICYPIFVPLKAGVHMIMLSVTMETRRE